MCSDHDDTDEILRAAAGDSAALDKILRYQQPRLLQFVQASMSAQLQAFIEADDIVHLTFIAVFRGINRFKPSDDVVLSFRRWINQIAINQIRRAARKQTAALAKLAGELLDESPDLASSVGRQTAKHETYALLSAAIADLPDESRQAIMSLYFDDKTMAEIALALDSKEGRVNGILQRARRQLRRKLGSSSLYFLPAKRRRGKSDGNENPTRDR